MNSVQIHHNLVVATWRSMTHKCDSESMGVKNSLSCVDVLDISTAEGTFGTCLTSIERNQAWWKLSFPYIQQYPWYVCWGRETSSCCCSLWGNSWDEVIGLMCGQINGPPQCQRASPGWWLALSLNAKQLNSPSILRHGISWQCSLKIPLWHPYLPSGYTASMQMLSFLKLKMMMWN